MFYKTTYKNLKQNVVKMMEELNELSITFNQTERIKYK